jgi:hypothetical protein
MALFSRRPIAHTPHKTLYIADQQLGLIHRDTCSARPPAGISFGDPREALALGYESCACVDAILVAPTERIRELLATTMPQRRPA